MLFLYSVLFLLFIKIFLNLFNCQKAYYISSDSYYFLQVHKLIFKKHL